MVMRIKSNIDSGIFKPLQEAGCVALQLGDEWLNRLNEVYRERQTTGYQILQCLGCNAEPKQSGMFLWAALPDEYADAEEFSDNLLEQSGVFITPGLVFGNNGRQYMRLSLCASDEVLNEALNRIKNRRSNF